MRILIVFSHPATESFQHSILGELAGRLEGAGHQVRVCDLYAEGFDPVLRAEGWRAHRGDVSAPAEVGEHIAALREAEGLVLVYPTWWYGLPAMLKGWLDRVWQPGVAFVIDEGGFRTHCLPGLRRFAVVTTYGSPRGFITWIVGDPVRRQLMRGAALQFARGVRRCWRPIYDVDVRSPQDLAGARGRAVDAVVGFFGRS